MNIIGLSGRAKSGKDTVAVMLGRHGYHRRAFADPLKAAAQAIFGLNEVQVMSQEAKERVDEFWGLSPRQIMQRLGTECLRSGFRDDVWVRSLYRYILDNPQFRAWVVSDVRFPNEAEAIKSWGGRVWRVERPGIEAVSEHVSETAMDDYDRFDHVIVNDGGLDDLEASVGHALAQH